MRTSGVLHPLWTSCIVILGAISILQAQVR